VSQLFNLLFFQDVAKPVIEESDLSRANLTSGIMLYILSTTEKQKRWTKLPDSVWKSRCISS